jgi:hypothetical protein
MPNQVPLLAWLLTDVFARATPTFNVLTKYLPVPLFAGHPPAEVMPENRQKKLTPGKPSNSDASAAS